MPDETLQHLSVDNLSIQSMNALTKFGGWLNTSDFQLDRGCLICSDATGLQENARPFIQHLRSQTLGRLPWHQRPKMLGLRIATVGARIPLATESKLFGVMMPAPSDYSVVVLCTQDDKKDVRLIRGQYMLLLEEIHAKSTFDCLNLYFEKQ